MFHVFFIMYATVNVDVASCFCLWVVMTLLTTYVALLCKAFWYVNRFTR